jgi:hypothetical protein
MELMVAFDLRSHKSQRPQYMSGTPKTHPLIRKIGDLTDKKDHRKPIKVHSFRRNDVIILDSDDDKDVQVVSAKKKVTYVDSESESEIESWHSSERSHINDSIKRGKAKAQTTSASRSLSVTFKNGARRSFAASGDKILQEIETNDQIATKKLKTSGSFLPSLISIKNNRIVNEELRGGTVAPAAFTNFHTDGLNFPEKQPHKLVKNQSTFPAPETKDKFLEKQPDNQKLVRSESAISLAELKDTVSVKQPGSHKLLGKESAFPVAEKKDDIPVSFGGLQQTGFAHSFASFCKPAAESTFSANAPSYSFLTSRDALNKPAMLAANKAQEAQLTSANTIKPYNFAETRNSSTVVVKGRNQASPKVDNTSSATTDTTLKAPLAQLNDFRTSILGNEDSVDACSSDSESTVSTGSSISSFSSGHKEPVNCIPVTKSGPTSSTTNASFIGRPTARRGKPFKPGQATVRKEYVSPSSAGSSPNDSDKVKHVTKTQAVKLSKISIKAPKVAIPRPTRRHADVVMDEKAVCIEV